MNNHIKIIDNVLIKKDFESKKWFCNYDDYAKVKKGEELKEEAFCNWCDDKGIIAVG